MFQPKHPKYFEAWYVQKGQIYHFDHKTLKKTDSSSNPSRPDTWGHDIVEGEVRFYCLSVTGPIGAQGQPGGWKIKNPDTEAGSLLSTIEVPLWWLQGNGLRDETAAARSGKSDWNCCSSSCPSNTVECKP